MKKRKISFLIAAHNEEKIIEKTLNNLAKLPYDNYEVIIGLDGCTDNTEKIVSKYCKKDKKFRYYKMNFRQGKPAVINHIIKKARGEIIIINDADWIFKVKDRDSLIRFLSIFDDESIGGIAESFPIEWDGEKLNRGNIGFKMVTYGTFFWLEFQKRRFGKKKNGFVIPKKHEMFLTNIFRRKLYRKNVTLGDDFERTKDIKNQGYEVILFNDENMPRLVTVYDKIDVKDIIKQKIRTGIARRQLELTGKGQGGMFDYYLPAAFYIFRKSWKRGFSVGSLVTLWLLITAFGEVISKFKKIDTKKGWLLRAQR